MSISGKIIFRIKAPVYKAAPASKNTLPIIVMNEKYFRERLSKRLPKYSGIVYIPDLI